MGIYSGTRVESTVELPAKNLIIGTDGYVRRYIPYARRPRSYLQPAWLLEYGSDPAYRRECLGPSVGRLTLLSCGISSFPHHNRAAAAAAQQLSRSGAISRQPVAQQPRNIQ
eukprot:COSAG01_NODE_5707_length_4085_cov_6.959107_1_plen_112_part_00